MQNLHNIREELEKKFKENSSLTPNTGWLYSLDMQYDEHKKTLFVVFPHGLFETWFTQHKQHEFENYNKEIILSKYGHTPLFVYKNPAQKQRTASFFTKNPPTQSTDFFEEFIYNKKNAFPLAVLREIAKNPFEVKYNPFILHGKTSTGKTHILHCMKNAFLHTHAEKVILHENFDSFCKKLSELGPKKLCQTFSIFILDTLENSKAFSPLQEAFIEFVELCLTQKKQLILASALTPEEETVFSPSLRSRLHSGLVVQLKEADIDVRMRYAMKHCKGQGIKLSKEHILLIAQRCSTIALLRGVILKILAFQTHTNSEVYTSDIDHILSSTGEEEKKLSPQAIIFCIANYFDMAEESILGDKRTPDIVRARQMSMYLCRDILGLSYPVIGKIFGGKDHSTVMYAIKKIKKLRDTNKDMQHMVTELRKKCFTP